MIYVHTSLKNLLTNIECKKTAKPALTGNTTIVDVSTHPEALVAISVTVNVRAVMYVYVGLVEFEVSFVTARSPKSH